MTDKLDIPQGTLDLMILTILAREPLHGYGISQRLAALSHDNFHVNPGSLFPSLYRLEQDGQLKAEWKASDNNRNAKYYRITPAGRRQLEQHRRRWDRISFAIARGHLILTNSMWRFAEGALPSDPAPGVLFTTDFKCNRQAGVPRLVR